MRTVKIIVVVVLIFLSMTHGAANNRIAISPFVDLSYDLGEEKYWEWIGTSYYKHNGTNLSLGINIYREPLFLQFQIANLIDHFRKGQHVFGTGKIGMFNEIINNGYIEMDLSMTDDLLKEKYEFPAYSGSIGYYHLLKPFSVGINFGFINRNYRNLSAIFEATLNTKYLTPYLALGVMRPNKNAVDCTGFFSIGIQAEISRTTPFYSGSRIKLNYYKEKILVWI
ncbi:MAG: hypothetical protein ACETVX_00905 [bacterium]